jgi:hypothetical protein
MLSFHRSDRIIPSAASVNHPKARTRGRTYDNPIPGGYTAHHAAFKDDIEFWRQKASNPKQAKAIEDLVAIKVHMGRVPPGQKKIVIIWVSID